MISCVALMVSTIHQELARLMQIDALFGLEFSTARERKSQACFIALNSFVILRKTLKPQQHECSDLEGKSFKLVADVSLFSLIVLLGWMIF